MTKKEQRKLSTCSIGVMCHNEAQNISYLLQSLVTQTCWKRINKIIVISSGSTDNTNIIVKSFAKKYSKIVLIKERERKGKSHAVNTFLSKTKEHIVFLMSADLLPKKNALELMIRHFKDDEVGIVGAHPIPLNNKKKFIGYAVHLLWSLHHYISLEHPKMGEMIAFRRIFQKIPVFSAVDEVSIESVVKGQGYKAFYEPKAIVRNRGPETIVDFIKVRRRIFAGHIATKHEYSYSVSTLDNVAVCIILLRHFELSITSLCFLIGTIVLECTSRMLGYVDYTFNLKKHFLWEIAKSTKKLK